MKEARHQAREVALQALYAWQLSHGDAVEQMKALDGFEDAVKQIGQIEATLGLADLARFTAPPPPKI